MSGALSNQCSLARTHDCPRPLEHIFHVIAINRSLSALDVIIFHLCVQFNLLADSSVAIKETLFQHLELAAGDEAFMSAAAHQGATASISRLLRDTLAATTAANDQLHTAYDEAVRAARKAT